MLVDTCFCIDLLREKKKRQPACAIKKLQQLKQPLYMPLFVACELHAGAQLSTDPQKEGSRISYLMDFMTIVVPDVQFAYAYGKAEANLRRQGQRIPVMDLMIGVLAVTHSMPLLTKDIQHYSRITDLVIETY